MNIKSLFSIALVMSLFVLMGCNNDKTSPMIEITSPTSTSMFIPGDTAHIHFTVTEDEAMHQVSAVLMNTETMEKSLDTTIHEHDLSFSFHTMVVLDVPAHSNHMLTVTAEDEAGNVGTESVHFHVME